MTMEQTKKGQKIAKMICYWDQLRYTDTKHRMGKKFKNASRKCNYLLRKFDFSLERPKPKNEAFKLTFEYPGRYLGICCS